MIPCGMGSSVLVWMLPAVLTAPTCCGSPRHSMRPPLRIFSWGCACVLMNHLIVNQWTTWWNYWSLVYVYTCSFRYNDERCCPIATTVSISRPHLNRNWDYYVLYETIRMALSQHLWSLVVGIVQLYWLYILFGIIIGTRINLYNVCFSMQTTWKNWGNCTAENLITQLKGLTVNYTYWIMLFVTRPYWYYVHTLHDTLN